MIHNFRFLTPHFLLIFIVSCSTIHYRSTGEVPIKVTGVSGHNKTLEKNGHVDFYFWGQYPRSNIVYLDQLAANEGFTSISRLEIHEYLTFMDFMKGLLSFGLYTPRSFTIKAYGLTDKVDTLVEN